MFLLSFLMALFDLSVIRGYDFHVLGILGLNEPRGIPGILLTKVFVNGEFSCRRRTV
jgi:hypothetical protein